LTDHLPIVPGNWQTPLKQRVMTVTIDKFGRVLIPKAIRERLQLTPGAELTLEVHDSHGTAPSIELRHEEAKPPLVRKGGLLVFTGKLPDDFDFDEHLKKQREERSRRIMGLD
jgi:AbrB family looped-hinge helix DNA binding protein